MNEQEGDCNALMALGCCAGALGLAVWLLAISPQSILTLVAAFAVSCTLALASVGRQELRRITAAFILFAILSVVLYHLQLAGFPDWFGFSGPPGIGTDDSYYYSIAVPEVPAELPVRPNFYLDERPYGNFLKLLAIPAHALFGSVHPLDLVFLNVALLALLPSLTARLVKGLGLPAPIPRIAWYLTLTCPFLLANGLVLLRDGVVAVSSIAALVALLERRYVAVFVWLVATAYMRLEHAVLLLLIIWVIFWLRLSQSQETSTSFQLAGQPIGWIWLPMIGVPLVAIGLLFAVLPALVGGDAVANLLLRTDFLETFILLGTGGNPESSLFYQIAHLPWVIRLPLALAFYFLSPLSDIPALIHAEYFVARDYLYSAFGLAMIPYSGLFVRGVFYAFNDRSRLLIALILLYLIELLIISQASMQLRHKVPLIPLFYVVVACGLWYRGRIASVIAILVSAMVGLAQVLLSGWRLAVV